jgi:copper homeostasis protein CutC
MRRTQIKYLELMKRLMKRSRKKIKIMEIEILNPENTKKFSDEK